MLKKNILLLAILLLLPAPFYAQGAAVPAVTPQELNEKLDNFSVIILDARSGHDWNISKKKIKGAIRAAAADYEQWKNIHPKEATIILYCS